MSENQNRGIGYSSKYDTMATEELEEILRMDSESLPGQELETEELLYVMEVLAGRRNESHTGKTVQESWNSFERNYLNDNPPSRKCHPAGPSRSWLRRLSAVAAIVIILVGIPLAANAFNLELTWNAVANWAKDTFSFSERGANGERIPSKTDERTYSSLQDALNNSFSNPIKVPSVIPDGFELTDIKIDDIPDRKTILAFYSNGAEEFRIQIQNFLFSDAEIVEINEPLLELYQTETTDCYIFYNNNQLQAAWVDDSFECYISGELTIEEVKLMIDSIEKG